MALIVQSHPQEENKFNSSIILGIHVYTLADDEVIESTFNKKKKQLLKANKILRKMILLGPVLQW